MLAHVALVLCSVARSCHFHRDNYYSVVVEAFSVSPLSSYHHPLVALSSSSSSSVSVSATSTIHARGRRRVAVSTAAVTSDAAATESAVAAESESESSSSSSSKSITQSSHSYSFIDSELRGAAMKLHTRVQAPREGQAEEAESASSQEEPYVTTIEDYLQFLVDSQHVYQAMEDIVNHNECDDALKLFRNTGLERTIPLETDIEWMCQHYHLERPSVNSPGQSYAHELHQIFFLQNNSNSNTNNDSNNLAVPEFVCHWYNHYFAHTAGGRMIGKSMAALLLDKKTLEFYKWKDLNQLKTHTKQIIEELAASWTPEQRQACVDATGAAFRAGGAINAILRGQYDKKGK